MSNRFDLTTIPVPVIVALFVLTAFSVWADTTWVAAGNVSGTWTIAGSPYIVYSGNIAIPAESQLTIDPGVRVFFSGPYRLTVHGKLLAQGTMSDSVRFTTDTIANPNRWRGISVFAASGDTSRFEYCVIEFGQAQDGLWYDSCGGALRNIAGRVIAFHCTFRYNRATVAGGAVYSTVATTILENCRLQENYAPRSGGAVYVNAGVRTQIGHTDFLANVTDDLGGGIMLFRGNGWVEHSVFRHNRCGSQGGALTLIGMAGALTSCVIDSNVSLGGSGGAYISDSTTVLTIDSCVFSRNHANSFTGGIYCWESAPVIRHTQIVNNSCGSRGGGLNAYRWGANPVLERCTIRENRCSNAGGGLCCATFATITLTDCDVTDNWSAGSGGGIWSENSGTVILTDCRIDSNSSDRNGGGIACRVSTVNLSNCEIRANQADSSGGGIWLSSCTVDAESLLIIRNEASQAGGGIYVSDTSPIFNALSLMNNSAGTTGGGFWIEGAQTAVISRGRISGNSAVNGGGVGCRTSNMNLENCLIVDNQVSQRGGGLFSESALGTTLIHCTVVRNSADSLGGNLFCHSQSTVLKNSIFAYSTPAGICSQGPLSPEISFCCFYQSEVTGNLPPGFGQVIGTNANGDSCDALINLFADPLFLDTAMGNWGLRVDSGVHSPCIGAAGPGGQSTDLDGNPRPSPAGSLPDMGALESPAGHDEGGVFGGLSGTIGPGFLRVVGDISVGAGQSLMIVAGTTFQFVGPYRFEIRGNVQALGTETYPIVFTCDTVLTPNRWRGLRFIGAGASSSRMEHCVIENSSAIGSGGGLYCGEGASPRFDHCLFRYNRSPFYGGAAAILNSSPVFDDCIISSNGCGLIGGGVYFGSGSAAVFSQCELVGNHSAGQGGGLASLDASAPLIVDCRIAGNFSADKGGGYYGRASRTRLTRCLVTGNQSATAGGALYLSQDTVQVGNCTLSDNSATSAGGILLSAGMPEVYNTIVAFNSSGMRFESASSARVLYCLLDSNGTANLVFANNNPANGPFSIGIMDSFNRNGDPCDRYRNLFLSPQFVNRFEADYRLLPTSPAVDGGDPERPRDPDQTVSDIGAFAVWQDVTAVPRSLRFGDVAVGDTSTRQFLLFNHGSIPVYLLTAEPNLSQFALVQNLVGAVIPAGDSLLVGVSFSPDIEQSFFGELHLVTDASVNDTLLIRLFGNGGIIPAPVKDLTVRTSGTNVILRWSAVDTTVYGTPILVDTYWVFEMYSPDSPPEFVAATGDTTFVIPGAVATSDRKFYTVVAGNPAR